MNLANTIVQSNVMAYSHILMDMLGEEVGGVVWGKEEIISFWPNFLKYTMMFKIRYMVALGSCVTFSPNLSKFSGGGGDDLFDKPFRNFLPLFWWGGGGLQNMSAEDDENFDKSELI